MAGSPPTAPPPTAPHTTTPRPRGKSKSRSRPASRPSAPAGPLQPETTPRIPDHRKTPAGKEPALQIGNSRQPTAPRQRQDPAHANTDHAHRSPSPPATPLAHRYSWPRISKRNRATGKPAPRPPRSTTLAKVSTRPDY